jgi:creatinine amidohydrolase
MIDAYSTTIDWQKHTGSIAVLPVGACEQHGPSLPIATDTIFAEYMGRMIAEACDAALLPPLTIATSLEQSGFRGTISLKPETAMAVIRDIADELERSRFNILVIANAHGGNHFLAPVARDINRMDRPLKIIISSFYVAGEDDLPLGGNGGVAHAGDSARKRARPRCGPSDNR